jgi:putative transposase
MPEYRRSFIEGGTYFFTVVTYNRVPMFTNPRTRRILRSALLNVKERYPFTLDSICLLPEHIHCIWTLPTTDSNYSLRWKEIKRLFTQEYLKKVGLGETRNESRQKRGEAAIWQRRFWEHTIRDEDDLGQHIDYIHYNPVKHGHVQSVHEWQWSSFHRYVEMGYYEFDWGSVIDQEVKELDCGE